MNVARSSPWPASAPCATITSAPAATASRANASVWTWQISLRAGGLDPLPKRGDFAERQHHAGGRMCEREFEQMGLLRKRPRNESAANAGTPSSGDFPLEPFGITIATADQLSPPASDTAAASLPPATRPIGRR